jgi:hypothetical protein
MSWYNPNRPGSGKGKNASRRRRQGATPIFRAPGPQGPAGAKPGEEQAGRAAVRSRAIPAGRRPGGSRPPVPRPPDEPGRGEFPLTSRGARGAPFQEFP